MFAGGTNEVPVSLRPKLYRAHHYQTTSLGRSATFRDLVKLKDKIGSEGQCRCKRKHEKVAVGAK